MRLIIALCALWVLATPALATNSPIELRTVLATLMEQLPGRFDNAAQLFFEQESKVAEKDLHGRVFRSFVRIDAPAIGPNVLVAQVRYGGETGSFDDGEFQVWTLAVDANKKAVKMAAQKFKDPARYKANAFDAAAFKGLTPADLAPAEGAASCPIFWRKYGDDLRGVIAPGDCKRMSSILKAEVEWAWEFILTAEELWITYAGRDAAGKIVSGRPDQAHWRLGKARAFECLLGYRPPNGAPQVNNGPHIHDRGGVLVWKTKAPAERTFHYELLRGMWPSNSGRNYEDLIRITMYEGEPADVKGRKLIGIGWASSESDRASFGDRVHNARCKLFDPSAPPPKNE